MQTTHDWARDAVFYHIYPLGLCGAPQSNDFVSAPVARLSQLSSWGEHMRALGVTALYLGPVFESGTHGYDTADYGRVDRRLGDNQTLAAIVEILHTYDIRVILDGVFHHVGRDFRAFRDLQANGATSAYRDWFAGIDFARTSPYGDPFAYEGWNGHYNLVKLNLHHPDLRAHLFDAVRGWIANFGIDGLRLDVADALDHGFLRDLAAVCRLERPDFWLLGEVIHGDYRTWANPAMLDAVTNYECYKGLFSSHNDRNYFEIAYSLQRQFGIGGIYRDLPLYNFADNHDVDRVASRLTQQAHLVPLYTLLFTMPGVPSIYYGSEWGIDGAKQGGDDSPLRPTLNLADAKRTAPCPDLARTIAALAKARSASSALRRGDYQQLHVAAEQFAFARRHGAEEVIIAVNASATAHSLELPTSSERDYVDLLKPTYRVTARDGRLCVDDLPPYGGRILAAR